MDIDNSEELHWSTCEECGIQTAVASAIELAWGCQEVVELEDGETEVCGGRLVFNR